LNRTYLDSSLVVASLVHEPGTSAAHRLLRQEAATAWLISSWVETELASALAMQGRRQAISRAERDAAWTRFEELREARLQVVAVEMADFAVAARLCLDEAAPLRAGDALHIALCLRQRCRLASFDQALCRAGAHHGLRVEWLQIER